MGEGFKRFKRRITLNTVLKSILYGLSLGITVCAGLTLLKKLAVLDIKLFACIATGAFSAVLFGVIMYFVLRQNNKKIARTLDRELGLKEKVKTMLDFGEGESAMLQLQREDANSRLMSASTKGYATRRIWIGILTLLLSAALLTGALLVPQKMPEAPYDPDYDMSDYETVSLLALIEHVKKSGMTQDAKDNVVEELEDLIDELGAAEKESQKKEIVITAIKDVKRDVDDATAYDQIEGTMVATELESMELLNTALKELISSQVSPSYEKLRAEFPEKENDLLAPMIERFSSELDASIRDFMGNKSLPLYATLASFSRGMLSLSENILSNPQSSEYAPAEVQKKLDTLFELAKDGLDGAMVDENANINEGKYVVTELMRIFSVSQADIDGESDSSEEPTDIEDASSDEIEDGNEGNGGDGGAGDGELVFGRNEMIYDPDSEGYDEDGEYKDGYVVYPDVFHGSADSESDSTAYSTKMYGMINDSNLPDEIKDYIQKYMDMLQGDEE